MKQIETQLKLLRRVSVLAKLPVINKEGYYLSQVFIDSLGIEYLENMLLNWDNTDRTEFNQKLKMLLEKELNEIEHQLESLGKREKIINCILELYRAKNYIALVPLVLSQVDGIMKEITKSANGMYSTEKGKPKYLSGNSFYVDFFSQAEQFGIDDRNNYELFAEKQSDTKFNRHAILHGESTEFGTELNSIKAMLLLFFIIEIHKVNN